MYDDEEGTADQWEYADTGDQPADSVEGMDDGDWENNNYEAALDNIFADENYGSNDPGEEDYSTAFETLQQEEVARRAAEWEAELARQRAEQERAQREAELARQRAEQERAQQKAALARRAAEREAALARQQAKKETSNILGGIVGGLTGQAVDSYLGGDSGLGSTVGGLVGGLLGNDTGAAIGQTLGGFDSGGVGFSESGSGEKYHYSSSTSSGDCNELTPACQQASLAANRQIENLPRDNRSQTERAQLFIKTCDIGIKMNRICYNNEPRPHCQALYKEQIQEYEKARREALQISRSVRE